MTDSLARTVAHAAGKDADITLQTSRPLARLYVESDDGLIHVYRLVDITTGDLLAELPRERARALQSLPDVGALAFVRASP